MNFGEKLQQLRKEKGLSQEQLAERLDVSRQAISKWESGQSYPETDKLIVLSDLFHVTLDSLLKDGDALSGGAPDTGGGASGGAPPPGGFPFWVSFGYMLNYEYKSKRTLWGLPLVHINLGFGMKKARGILAIGNVASGLLSVGLFARGLLSVGLFSLGIVGLGVFSLGLLLSVGAIAAGIFAAGAVALGVFALGAVSVGMFSVGALSVASHVAIGDHAYGHVAVGRVARGAVTFIDTSPGRDLSSVSAAAVRDAILREYPGLWRWIVNFMTAFLGG